MVLSQTAEYALRAMVWLAVNSPDAPVRASDLSAGTGIPVHYLSKILRRLVLAGVLTSQKGQGGGFNLSRAPEEIPFADILAAVDVYPSSDRCAFGWGNCNASNPCPLHEPWSLLSEAVRDWAANTTLAAVKNAPSRGRRRGARA
jgi:Rrf2 family iron-sulfur cluster assembly transcriptional regulator